MPLDARRVAPQGSPRHSPRRSRSCPARTAGQPGRCRPVGSGLSQQRNDLCPFKRHSGTLRVVLVIGVGRRRSLDDRVEVVVKCLTKRQCPEPFGRQYLPRGHGWSSGPVRVRLVLDPSTPYVPPGIPMRPPTEGEHLGSHLGHRGAPARCRCRRPGPPAGGMTEWRRARSRSTSFRTSSAAASSALTEAPHLTGPAGWVRSGAADARRAGGQPRGCAATLAVDPR